MNNKDQEKLIKIRKLLKEAYEHCFDNSCRNMEFPPKVYIAHYSRLVDRKAHILAQVERANLIPVLIEDYNQEDLTPTQLLKFDTTSLSLGEISLMLKQVKIWRMIINSNQPYGLVFEDDIFLVPNFVQHLQQALLELPSDFSLCMTDLGWGFHIPTDQHKPDTLIYERGINPTEWGGNGGTRGAGGYIISLDCTQKAVEYFDSCKKITKPIDWWMNDMLRTIQGRVFWTEPVLSYQGSNTNRFKSSLNH